MDSKKKDLTGTNVANDRELNEVTGGGQGPQLCRPRRVWIRCGRLLLSRLSAQMIRMALYEPSLCLSRARLGFTIRHQSDHGARTKALETFARLPCSVIRAVFASHLSPFTRHSSPVLAVSSIHPSQAGRQRDLSVVICCGLSIRQYR